VKVQWVASASWISAYVLTCAMLGRKLPAGLRAPAAIQVGRTEGAVATSLHIAVRAGIHVISPFSIHVVNRIVVLETYGFFCTDIRGQLTYSTNIYTSLSPSSHNIHARQH
jgi:hypothetical protein